MKICAEKLDTQDFIKEQRCVKRKAESQLSTTIKVAQTLMINTSSNNSSIPKLSPSFPFDKPLIQYLKFDHPLFKYTNSEVKKEIQQAFQNETLINSIANDIKSSKWIELLSTTGHDRLNALNDKAYATLAAFASQHYEITIDETATSMKFLNTVAKIGDAYKVVAVRNDHYTKTKFDTIPANLSFELLYRVDHLSNEEFWFEQAALQTAAETLIFLKGNQEYPLSVPSFAVLQQVIMNETTTWNQTKAYGIFRVVLGISDRMDMIHDFKTKPSLNPMALAFPKEEIAPHGFINVGGILVAHDGVHNYDRGEIRCQRTSNYIATLTPARINYAENLQRFLQDTQPYTTELMRTLTVDVPRKGGIEQDKIRWVIDFVAGQIVDGSQCQYPEYLEKKDWQKSKEEKIKCIQKSIEDNLDSFLLGFKSSQSQDFEKDPRNKKLREKTNKILNESILIDLIQEGQLTEICQKAALQVVNYV